MDINAISTEIYRINVENGFWDEERNFGEVLMLITSELAEALEADRKNRYADIAKFETDRKNVVDSVEETFKGAFLANVKDTVEDEMADAVIRIFDACKGFGIDIEKHIELKLKYNKTRGYKHGKRY